MQAFDFYCPTKIVFGAGREKETGAQVTAFGGKKAMIVFGGQSALKSGLIDRVETSLREAGIESLRLGGVHPNPLLSLAKKRRSAGDRKRRGLPGSRGRRQHH